MANTVAVLVAVTSLYAACAYADHRVTPPLRQRSMHEQPPRRARGHGLALLLVMLPPTARRRSFPADLLKHSHQAAHAAAKTKVEITYQEKENDRR